MSQPIASAWTTFRISRGLAQISSTCGYGASSSSAAAMIGIGSRPESAMRPAKTETKRAWPSGEPARGVSTCASVISAVTFTLTPSAEQPLRRPAPSCSRRVVVIGTFT